MVVVVLAGESALRAFPASHLELDRSQLALPFGFGLLDLLNLYGARPPPGWIELDNTHRVLSLYPRSRPRGAEPRCSQATERSGKTTPPAVLRDVVFFCGASFLRKSQQP